MSQQESAPKPLLESPSAGDRSDCSAPQALTVASATETSSALGDASDRAATAADSNFQLSLLPLEEVQPVNLTDVPDLVPARMINEFEYCPRLFYLEWVQSRFQHNRDTKEGVYVHRVVDAGGGVMGEADDPPFRKARSVELSSRRLGMIAKADIIEQQDREAVPVEVKRGRPPEHGLAWMPEKVQLCTIGLLLRDNGYKCTKGQIYFAKVRKRVTIPLDESLVEYTLKLVSRLRLVADAPNAPLPLLDSPKCPRCSLVGICLPDETNLHAGRSLLAPRRLTPRDTAARPLYVTEQGAKIGIRSGRVTVSKYKNQLEQVRLIDVSQISVYGNVQISSQMMRAAFREEIPVCWFSYGGWFQGIAEGLPSKHVELRRRQVAIAAQAGLPIAQSMIEGKLRNSRTLLRRNARSDVKSVLAQLKSLADSVGESESIESLLGLEGTGARLYFSKFAAMVRDQRLGFFNFDGRNRRPPRDPINCLLSYVYALLTKDLTAVAIAVGLDPYLGVFHRPRFGRPALALDLAEEFRPLVAESVVITVINNGEIQEKDFIIRAGGVSIRQQARRSVLSAYERRLDTEVTHPTYKYRITYRRVFEVQARVLAAHLIGEIPQYVPFMTR
ncbi:MAG: CRISPR-associated endonuclease Cas1 [Acidimicrobiaceae bacterium]|nr:CRISPR-associated endonuclease Cas1 [Acidimicrobiaceae bacterium]